MLRDGDAEPTPDRPPATPQVYSNGVGPGHFRTLRIPLLAGRDFTEADDDTAPRVAIVNETLAQRFWPGQNAIGQRLRSAGGASNARHIEVVGVVRNSKYVTIGEDARPFLYRPLAQDYTPRLNLLVKAQGPAAGAMATIRREVRALDPGLAVFNAATLVEATSISLLPARVAGGLLAALGMLALALAALGIYAVLSYLVQSRTREIGVRVAIGASPGRVIAMVVRQAAAWTVIGAAIGIVLALLVTRFLTAFLYGISPTDPLTFIGVTAVLALIACVAALVPAVRASRLDPLSALRSL